MTIDSIKNGIVIDHIAAGKAMELYRNQILVLFQHNYQYHQPHDFLCQLVSD